MGIGAVCWSIFLGLLLVMCSDGNGQLNAIRYPGNDDVPMVRNVLRLHSMDAMEKYRMENVHAYPTSHMDHMDPQLMVFFFIEDLKLGKRVPVYFPKRDPSKSPHFLSREESNSIPFTLESLPKVLQIFSFSQASPQAKAMEDTLTECEREPIKGESKLCATSLELMLDFVTEIFGSNSPFQVLSTTHIIESTTLLQNYTILKEPEEISAQKMVSCHTMPYPYAIFYCHFQESESKAFKVLLGGDNGDRVEAVAVCHLDTSEWSPNHVSFRVLGIEPGSKPVCHFFPADNLVWVAS